MKPMISGKKAYTDALAILTPDQRGAVIKRFNDPDYAPMVPSLASKVPSPLEVELEHGARDPETNVTSDDLTLTGKLPGRISRSSRTITHAWTSSEPTDAYWASRP